MHKMTWRKLNDILHTLTEEEVVAMLEAEKTGKRRLSVMERLHQRFCALRMTRERLELLQEAQHG